MARNSSSNPIPQAARRESILLTARRAAASVFASLKRAAGVVDSTVLQAEQNPKSKPQAGEMATYRTTDKQQSYRGTGLDLVIAANNAANSGDYRALAELGEQLEERDCHIAACLQTRKLAVTGKDWSVLPSGDAANAEKVAEACDKMLRSLPDFEQSCLDLLDGIFKGFAASEIIWDRTTPVDLVWRHQKKFRYNASDQTKPVDQILLVTEAFPMGEILPADKFIVHQPRLRSGWRSRGGLIRPLAITYTLKTIALQDWSRFVELFATPLRVGRYEPGTPDSEIRALQTGLAELGTDAYAVISKMSEISFPSAAGSGGDKVYLAICNYLDAQASKAILGHVASADAVSGSLGGAETTAVNIRQDILEADARALATTLRRDLLAPFVRFNFPGAEVPYIHIAVEEGEDLLARASVDEKLVAMGWQPPVSYISDVYGRPIAQPGEPVLTPPAAPPTAPAPGGGGGVANPPFEFSRSYDRAPLPNRNAAGYAEELARAALQDAMPMWRMYLEPVSRAIQDATSFEDLQKRLEKVGLKNEEIADLLHRAKLTAQMVGRLGVQGDLGMALGDVPAQLTPLPPEEAVKWLGKRIDMTPEAFQELNDAAKTAAFTVAGEQDKKIIEAVRGKIQTALDNGSTLEDFQKSLSDLETTDIGTAHAETVFRNAVNQSISAGRWKQQTDPEVLKLRPYLQYRTSGDGSVRSSHAKLDGLVYRADHDFWQTHYPPNGHNCRCTVVSLSERQVKAKGLTVQDESPDVAPDDGFAANPGMME